MNGMVYILMLVFGIAESKREEIVFDSTKEQKLGWDTFVKAGGGSGWTERSYGSRLIHVYSICDIDKPDSENWVTSPLLPTNGSDSLWVEVEYSLRDCPTDVETVCEFDIYSYEHADMAPVPLWNPWDHVMNVSTASKDSDSTVEIETVTFNVQLKKRGNKIALGFKDQGSCSTIMSLKAYVVFCDAVSKSLMTFNETSTLNVSREVKGECVPNAKTLSEPQTVCNTNGDWGKMRGKCECNAGFDSKDTACLAISSSSRLAGYLTAPIAFGLQYLITSYL